MTSSRTSKSLKNSVVALGFFLLNLGLQFFSRNIFLEYLGTEILGLNTTAMNMIEFLNLAELGISSAVGFTLYKPLHNNDHHSINEIVTLQAHLYRRIGFFILAGSLVLSAFFPLIFNKADVPLWYCYASFFVLLFSALLGYFFNYRQIVLVSSQQEYKILYSYKSVMLVKVCVQIAAVYYLRNGYVWWLICEFLFAIVATYTLDLTTRKNFPFLKTSVARFTELKKKYPEFTTKIKQLFFHKIGSFAIYEASPMIVYAFISLNMVAIYGNYLIVINGLIKLLSALFSGTATGVGNLVVEDDSRHILQVFREIFSVRFLIAWIVCLCFFTLSDGFINYWIGKQYILPSDCVMILTGILFIQLVRFTVDSYIQAYGIFDDILAPVFEAVINIVCSVILGCFFGLAGILGGILISQIIIVGLWKPYYVFSRGLKISVWWYVRLFSLNMTLCAISSLPVLLIINFLPSGIDSTLTGYLIHCGVLALLLFVANSGAMLIFDTGLRGVVKRLVKLK